MSGPRFPITYEIDLEKHDGDPAAIASGARPRILCGPPPEFDGSDAWWSPEQLLVSATAACFTATFSALATHAKLRVGEFRCHARGTLSRVNATIAFSSIELRVSMRVLDDDVGRARLLVADAKARCFVANSLRCPVEVTAEIHAS